MAWKGKNTDETYDEKIKWHQGLAGNVLLQESAFKMVKDAAIIEDLICDYSNPDNIPPKIHKTLNGVWRTFRMDFRDTISYSEADIPKADAEIVAKVHSVINRPYGTYDFHLLTDLAHEYFKLLRKLRLVLISIEHEELSVEAKWNKP
jgi:hypothetical protein